MNKNLIKLKQNNETEKKSWILNEQIRQFSEPMKFHHILNTNDYEMWTSYDMF